MIGLPGDGMWRLTRPFRRQSWAAPVDMTGKSVVVTGASPRSIGYFVAATLAAWGADTVVTATGRCETMVSALCAELDGIDGAGDIGGHPLDLADATSVAAFVEWYRSRRAKLHVLVNNAGVLLDVFSERTTTCFRPVRSLDTITPV